MTRRSFNCNILGSYEPNDQSYSPPYHVISRIGLRAATEAGFSRMNDLTVIQATQISLHNLHVQGLVKYLIETVPNVQDKGVVIGHDHRHHSNAFARLAAAVFLSLNIKVWFYRKLVHTPLVPYGVKKLGAGAGIMITASHHSVAIT
ncbi:hypothetical protein BC937DRAFT_88846 [Endogone sp. FLAS-F59071]|nr:hypothetical protein BC937DRAFT_88846 [Endogone sp. FLAS-F59071]|eukprot:RUS22477.1 hypothetical protein BC937DRAFT_88846 [Endogone sp. FLAS-F59071]